MSMGAENLIIRLGTAAGEDHFLRAGTDEPGNLLAGLLHHSTRTAAVTVHGGGIANPGHGLGHQGDNVRTDRRGGRVVEIERQGQSPARLAGLGAGSLPAGTGAGALSSGDCRLNSMAFNRALSMAI